MKGKCLSGGRRN